MRTGHGRRFISTLALIGPGRADEKQGQSRQAEILIYRVLSYWAVLPVGLGCWTAMHRRGRPGGTAGTPAGRRTREASVVVAR